MQLFVAGNYNVKTEFNFNSDLSGNVEIVAPSGSRLSIPCKHLLAFAAEVVRRDKTSALEDASDQQILGLRGTE